MLGLAGRSTAAPGSFQTTSQSLSSIQQEQVVLESHGAGHGQNSSIEYVPPCPAGIATPSAASTSPWSSNERSPLSTLPPRGTHRLVTRFEEEKGPQAEGLTLPPSLFTKSSSITFKLSPPSSPLLPPVKEKWSLVPAFKSTKSGEVKSDNRGSRFADWFQGESAPVTISVLPSPTKEKGDPMEHTRTRRDSRGGPSSTPVHNPRLRPQPNPRPSNSSPKLFSFFSKASTPPQQPPEAATDLLLSLDVKKALYPNGPLDSFSPASLKNLQQTAEGLLLDLQTAYRSRVLALQESTAEREAQADELDEAQTRTKHLKSQLNEMSSRIAEQDKHMMNLVEELAREKQLRREEAEARERARSVRLVTDLDEVVGSPRHNRMQRGSLTSTTSSSTPSMISDSESVNSVDGAMTREGRGHTRAYPDTPRTLSPVSATFPCKQTNSFTTPVHIVTTRTECTNCYGVKPRDAVRLVGDLRSENTALRRRVGHLEKELDGCLELVQGMVVG